MLTDFYCLQTKFDQFMAIHLNFYFYPKHEFQSKTLKIGVNIITPKCHIILKSQKCFETPQRNNLMIYCLIYLEND